jgi:hypothetical protein
MRWGLLPLAAALLALTGCHDYWGTSSSGSGSATYGSDASAESVRAAIPAIEAYRADHGSYAGLTVEVLRSYDNAIGDFSIVVAKKASYCIESTAGGTTYSYRGPIGPLAPVSCSEAPPAQLEEPPPPSYDAQTNVRAAIPAIEAYYADNGTYLGMNVDKLRQAYDAGLPDVKLVRVRKDSYCVESSVGEETWSYQNATGPAPRAC